MASNEIKERIAFVEKQMDTFKEELSYQDFISIAKMILWHQSYQALIAEHLALSRLQANDC